MDDSLHLYDPLLQLGLGNEEYIKFQFYNKSSIDYGSMKEEGVFLCDPLDPCTPFIFKEKLTVSEFLKKYGNQLTDEQKAAFDINPFAWRENRQIYNYEKQYKTDMNYYTTRPTGGHAIQWKGSNLHEIVELLPNSSAAIDKESGSLTLLEGYSTHQRQYFLHLKDWLYAPCATPGRIEAYDDDEFRRKFELQKKVQSPAYGALSDNVTSNQAGCHNVHEIKRDPHPTLDSLHASIHPNMSGQVQG